MYWWCNSLWGWVTVTTVSDPGVEIVQEAQKSLQLCQKKQPQSEVFSQMGLNECLQLHSQLLKNTKHHIYRPGNTGLSDITDAFILQQRPTYLFKWKTATWEICAHLIT